MSHSTHETEIKLAVPDRSTAARLLRTAGFRVSKRRIFESNIVFDTANQTLRNASSLLRLREARGVHTLTYKGPPEVSRHKSREEIEVEVSKAAALRTILERLGFREVFRYEKYRTELRPARGAGLATLDETPIGVFLELEGAPRWIDRTARVLGFQAQDYITASYARLYLEWCERHGKRPGNLVF